MIFLNVNMKKFKMRRGKLGQIWVETVIYTLIGLAIIGVVLALVKPAIDEKKDQLVLDQSLSVLNYIKEKVEDVRDYGTGNSRAIEIKIQKGKLIINAINDSIEFYMKSSYKYSQLNQSIMIGKISSLTRKIGKEYEVTLKLDYKDKINISWNSQKIEKIFQPSPTPYNFVVNNKGSSNNLANLDFN